MALLKRCGIFIFLFLVLSIFIQASAESRNSGSLYELGQSKMFLEVKKMDLENGVPELATNEKTEDWELRRVPSGSNPLHHNGQGPKKPRTP